MRRRLFAVASAISLLLCFATIGLWVRSYWVLEFLGFGRTYWTASPQNEGFDFHSWDATEGWTRGATWVEFLQDAPGHYSESERKSLFSRHENLPGPFVFFDAPVPADEPFDYSIAPFGFHWHGFFCGFEDRGTCRVATIAGPAWPLTAGTSLLPLLWLGRFLLRHRSPGICRKCGYNLTGNTSGVCPECGTPVAGKVSARA